MLCILLFFAFSFQTTFFASFLLNYRQEADFSLQTSSLGIKSLQKSSQLSLV